MNSMSALLPSMSAALTCLSMLCPTTPHLRTFEVIMGELTKYFRPIHGHLTLSFSICVCDEYGFRTHVCFLTSCKAIEVLVRVGPRSRVIHIESERKLVAAIRRSFSDVPRVANADLIIQIKDEDWGREFVDLKEDQVIPNRSVLNVIPQVGFMMVFETSFFSYPCESIFF